MNKTKNKKIKRNITKKNKMQEDIPTKMNFYITYIENLKQHFH